MLDYVCEAIAALRAARQLRHTQFHWGSPAAWRAPENSKANQCTPAKLDCARVSRAFEEDQHVFDCGFDPFFLDAFH